MATAVLTTACLVGIDAQLVSVEIHLQRGTPRFDIVGLPDNSIRESRTRVMSAIKNTTGEFPISKITVNLSPANLNKYGTGFDLPIALAILEASGAVPRGSLKNHLLVGELSLLGELRPVAGVLSIAHKLSQIDTDWQLICAQQNAAEASLIKDLKVCYADNLLSLIRSLQDKTPLKIMPYQPLAPAPLPTSGLDIADVKGQEKGKRALEIAAAGGHHLLFFGPPGSGKTMLAKRLGTILPELSPEDAIEVAKIYSVAGLPREISKNLLVRPFREPHHNISSAGLIGGGSNPRPGEISLAHHGILFMDEFPEFPGHILDQLRQPLENNQIIISRAKLSLSFPCRFQLIAAMNPCPCGYHGDKQRACHCRPYQIAKYRARLSGPIMDRIDLQVSLPNLNYDQMQARKNGPSSQIIKERVKQAVMTQKIRFNHQDRRNAIMTRQELEKFVFLGQEERKFFSQAMDKLKFSNRAHDKILKISRTIADLAGKDAVTIDDLAEALNYRYFDRQAQTIT